MSEKQNPFVTVYGSAVEGCFVTWTLSDDTNTITAGFDCPFYSTTIQGQATGDLPSLIMSSTDSTLNAFVIAFGIENNAVGATIEFAGMYIKT